MVNFGFITEENLKFKVIKEAWLECERLGFDYAWYSDHLIQGGYFLECWTLLSALSSLTKSLRFGPMVLCNSNRYPPVVANMSATLDVISDGRLELGIGAGWNEDEYTAYNIPFPRTAIRIGQMKEAVKIIKKMWTEDSVTYRGKYFSVKDLKLELKPVQKPHPRIWIGGYGEKFLLKTVAEVADGYILRKGATPEEYSYKMDVLQKHCRNVGRDFHKIRKAWAGCVFIGKDEREAKKKLRTFGSTYRSKEKTFEHFVEESIHGTSEECVEKIIRYLDAGVTDIMMRFPTEDQRDFKPLQLFSERVVPTFKEK